MRSAAFFKLLNIWPPYFGAGIRVTHIASDFTEIHVEMKLRFWNRNYVGTHFGGSLYSMVDPFLMLMLMQSLGKEYVVWDKAASIRFRKPGRGRVKARFQMSPQQVESIRSHADQFGKVEPEFQVEIQDESGSVVAEVHKTLYVRRKDRVRMKQQPDSSSQRAHEPHFFQAES